MNGKEYSQLLKRPEWQKKRLEMLELSNYACYNCGETTLTLHVHHTIYRKDTMPWDYSNNEYLVLCEHCHEDIHIQKNNLNELLAGEDSASKIEMCIYICEMENYSMDTVRDFFQRFNPIAHEYLPQFIKLFEKMITFTQQVNMENTNVR